MAKLVYVSQSGQTSFDVLAGQSSKLGRKQASVPNFNTIIRTAVFQSVINPLLQPKIKAAHRRLTSFNSGWSPARHVSIPWPGGTRAGARHYLS